MTLNDGRVMEHGINHPAHMNEEEYVIIITNNCTRMESKCIATIDNKIIIIIMSPVILFGYCIYYYECIYNSQLWLECSRNQEFQWSNYSCTE